MAISGLQKMTLLDFPGRVACTVFLGGCNYRCPFCHNSGLLAGPEELMTVEAFLSFLSRRRGLLDGVCVSGGEPTLSRELEALLRGIRELGFAVKLDTNGSRPEVLKHLVSEGLVDYVAMDVKNSPDRYDLTCGASVRLADIEESLRFLLSGSVDYELRTTVVQPLHDGSSMEQMGQWLAGILPGRKPKRLYLQSFVDRETVTGEGLCPPEPAQLEAFRNILAPFAEDVVIRG